MKRNVVKQLLRDGKPTVGTWLSLCSPIAARFLARSGFHWLNVDLEHSPADWETMATIFGFVAEAGCVPMARVPAGRHDHIKRVLDNGGFGFVVPMVMNREEAELCVRAAKHPPLGNRSLGGSLHALNYATTAAEYYRRANDEVVVVLQCEHIKAVERADEIFSVDGIDAIFVGPNDLKASMTSATGSEPSQEEFERALDRILAACRRHRVAAGIHCFTAQDVKRRIDQGWQFLALGSDLSLLLQGAKGELSALDLAPLASLANY
jgi:4-hydroxy-2-oxoheptanedioate aldolase